MNFYTNWSEDWVRDKEESEAKKQLEENTALSVDIEAISKRRYELEQFNPREDENLLTALASEGVSNRDYHELWKTSNNNNYRKYEGFSTQEDREHQSLAMSVAVAKYIMEEAADGRSVIGMARNVKPMRGLKHFLDSKYMGTDFSGTLFHSALLGLNAFFQSFQGMLGPSFGMEYDAAMNELLKQKGIDATPNDFRNYPCQEAEKNKANPWLRTRAYGTALARMFGTQLSGGLAGARAGGSVGGGLGAVGGFVVGMAAQQALRGNYENNPGLVNDRIVFTPSDAAIEYMGEIGFDYEALQEANITDIGKITEMWPDIYEKQYKLVIGDTKRELTPSEKAEITYRTFDAIVAPETRESMGAIDISKPYEEGKYPGLGWDIEPIDLPGIINRSDILTDAEMSRQGMYEMGAVANIGDFYRYLFSSTMENKYSPKYYMAEDINQQYEIGIAYILEAQRQGLITEDEQHDLLEEIETEANERLTSLEFHPEKKGAGRFFSGALNIYAMYKTDPWVMASGGVGVGGRTQNLDEVLTGIGKKYNDEVIEGAKTSKQFWDEHDDVLQAWSKKYQDLLEQSPDAPVAVAMIENGMHPEVALRLVENPENAYQILKSLVQEGFIADVRVGTKTIPGSKIPYGGDAIGDAPQYAIQAKVLDDNFIDNIAELMKGKPSEVLYNKAQYTSTGSILDIFAGRDVRLPSKPWGDLGNPTDAADTFYKVGRMFSIPEHVIEKHLRPFIRAVKNNDQALAQKIYYDDLLQVEGAIQLKAVWGLSDDEIKLFFQKSIDDVRGFGTEGSIYNAAIKNKFQDPDFINIIVRKTFGDLFADDEGLELFANKFISMISQTRDMSIAIPDLRTSLRYTGIKRKLRNVVSGSKTVDDSIKLIREQHEAGVKGTFFDPETPLGKATASAFADMKDPSAIYKAVEKGIGALESGAFTFISRGWMPMQLLFRLSFPLKVMLDGQLRMSTLGIDSLFRNPVGLLKLILNDPDGYLAKGLGVNVTTGLKSPFRTITDKGPGWLPKSVRRVINVVKEGRQEYSIPEVMDMFMRDPKFTSQFTRPSEMWEEVLKQGAKNVKLQDGRVLPFVPNDKYVQSYVDFLITQLVHDPLMPKVATWIREGLTDEQMAARILESQDLTQAVLTLNKKIIARNSKDGGIKIVKVIENEEDIVSLVAQYRQTANGFAGGSDEILEIIATQSVDGLDLTHFNILRAVNADKAKRSIQKRMESVYQELPESVPAMTINDANSANFLTTFFDSMFFTVGQIEAVWSRIPTFKQAYYHFLENNIPFATKDALADLLKVHYDSKSPVNLPDNIVELAKRNIKEAKLSIEEIDDLMKHEVPIKLNVSEDTVEAVLYTTDGLFDPRLFRGADNTDELVFQLDLQAAERTAYITDKAIADVRAGANNTKISSYQASMHKDSLIMNGGLSDKQRINLSHILETRLQEGTLVRKIVQNIEEALDNNPTMSYDELIQRLGISNEKIDIHKLADDLAKGKRTREGKEIINNATPGIVKKVLGYPTNKPIPSKPFYPNQADEIYENIIRQGSNDNVGGSFDLSIEKTIDGQDLDFLEGIYVSPYKKYEEIVNRRGYVAGDVIETLDDFSPQVIKNFIQKNKDLLSKEGHVLGIWQKGDEIYLDVTLKLPLGDENIAKASYLGLLSKQKEITMVYKRQITSIDDVGNLLKQAPDLGFTSYKIFDGNNNITYTALNWIKEYGEEFMKDIRKWGAIERASGVKPIVRPKRGTAVNTNDVLYRSGIQGNLSTIDDLNRLTLYGGGDNPMISQLTPIDYHTVLDLDGARSGLRRVMTHDDLDRRAAEYGYDLHNRLLYNLLQRGYLAEAYRVILPFFEAYREVLGRYATLATVNPRAAAQAGFAYRKGVETNTIYEDQYGEKYLIIPVGGTPLESYVKSEGEGLWTQDMDLDDSKVILKRGIPISALGVAGGGLYPPLGPVIALPVGYLTKDKPNLRRTLERSIFQFGLPFEGRGDTWLGELVEESMPSVGRNLFSTLGEDGIAFGIDEDIWFKSLNEGIQIASILYPDIAQDFEAIEPIAEQIAKNIYQLKAWDRFINPYAPYLRVLYKFDTDSEMFQAWYGTKGEKSGLVWNSFVELSVIHSMYYDLREQYSHTMGSRAGDFEAMKQMVILFDLGRYDLEESFTSVSLVKQGKKITEEGKLPRTKPEYDWVLDNEEEYQKYGGAILYFFEGLGKGDVDYSAYQSLDNMRMVTPLTEDEFFYAANMYAASVVERAMKDKVRKQAVIEEWDEAQLKIKMAGVELKLRELFPLAYGRDLGELSKLQGYNTVKPQEWDTEIRLLEMAVEDGAFSDNPLTPYLERYFEIRRSVIAAIQVTNQWPLKETALEYIVSADHEDAQKMRDYLYQEGLKLAKESPMFAIVFNEVFYEEISYYGIGLK